MNLVFPNNILAHVHVSWLDPCKTRRVTLVGDRRMAVYDDVAALDKVLIYDRGVECPPYTDTYGEFQLSYRYGDVRAPRLEWEEPLRRECRHFAECVRDGGAPRTDGASARRVVAVLEAASQSLERDGVPVEVDGTYGRSATNYSSGERSSGGGISSSPGISSSTVDDC